MKRKDNHTNQQKENNATYQLRTKEFIISKCKSLLLTSLVVGHCIVVPVLIIVVVVVIIIILKNYLNVLNIFNHKNSFVGGSNENERRRVDVVVDESRYREKFASQSHSLSLGGSNLEVRKNLKVELVVSWE